MRIPFPLFDDIYTKCPLSEPDKKAITSLLHDFTACSGGVYGQNCSLPCGQCLDNEQCHHINGTCMNGCGKGYQGLNCTEGQHLHQFTTC